MDFSGNETKKAEILHKMIEMVVRQTSYDYDTAKEKLTENKWDYMYVIREEMGIKEKTNKKQTLNQEIYSQIRKKMDEAGNKIY